MVSSDAPKVCHANADAFTDKRDPHATGKVEHSCRSTRDKQNKQKTKYQERVKTAKEQKEKTTQRRKEARRDNNRRTRMGWCFTLLAGLEAFDLGEIEKMPQDDIDGMVELWPEDDDLKDDIPVIIDDYKVGITVETINFATPAAAGVPFVGIANAISKILAPFKAAGSAVAYTALRLGRRSKASDSAIKGARGSGTVSKILKDKRMMQCLRSKPEKASKARRDDQAVTEFKFQASSGSSLITVRIDANAAPNDAKVAPAEFDDRQIIVKGMADTDSLLNPGPPPVILVTYPDKFGRANRLQYESCTTLLPYLQNQLTAVAVEGGCCAWYADSDCKQSSFLFTMENREDLQLDNKHNDNAEALWCTFQAGCKGAPGAPE